EGQGAEHSSARLERFLQACAEDNIQVCNLTTAAQYFHVLRRQMKRDFIKPLIVATPKSLLRAKYASSPAEEFIHGRFEEVLGSPEAGPVDNVERIIFCSGKVYFDLLKYRSERKIGDAALLRIEQLYPLAEKRLREMLKAFPKRANLAAREPEMLRNWEETQLYREIQKSREGRELFVLHDGPPFANGDVHMGTALNKILKDFVVKSQTMLGKRAPYVPGWDCHGLP